MARQPLRVARANRAQLAPYTGPSGEPIWDTDTGRLYMQDGMTPGGIPMVRCGRKSVANVNYSAGPGDSYIGVSQLDFSPTITLPKASLFVGGQPLYIADETGLCSFELPIIVIAFGSDTISGEASARLVAKWQKMTFHSNELNLWTFA